MDRSLLSLRFLRPIVPERIWEIARWRRVRARIRRFPRRWVLHRYDRIELLVPLHDRMGEVWYGHDWPDPLPEIELLRRGALRPGALVFDLGAHYGVVAAMLAADVSPGRVVAVEGNPHNVHAARELVRGNRIENLEIVHAVVGDHVGEERFGMDLNGAVHHRGDRVPSVTVDALAERSGTPQVLMIDVEGYEAAVLRGAQRTLETRPDLAIELHIGCGLEEHGGDATELIDDLAARGYELWLHSEEERTPRPAAEARELLVDRCFLTALAPRDS